METCNFLHIFQQLDGNLTLNENIADIEGLRMSYQAYKDSVMKLGPEPRLPGLTQPLTRTF